jgi:hypothetical protein
MIFPTDVVGGHRRPAPLPIAIATTDTSIEQVDEVTPCELRREVAALNLLVDAVSRHRGIEAEVNIPGLHVATGDEGADGVEQVDQVTLGEVCREVADHEGSLAVQPCRPRSSGR